MIDHSPSKLSPTAEAFKPGAISNNEHVNGLITDAKGELQFTSSRAPEFLAQKEQINTAIGDFKKFKGKPNWKNKPNKQQHRNQPEPAYHASEQALSTICEAKLKALGKGMKYMCVGCGSFGKRAFNQTHNWRPILETDYSSYLTARECPHSYAFKKNGDRQAEKQ
jgi:hypothetical protein